MKFILPKNTVIDLIDNDADDEGRVSLRGIVKQRVGELNGNGSKKISKPALQNSILDDCFDSGIKLRVNSGDPIALCLEDGKHICRNAGGEVIANDKDSIKPLIKPLELYVKSSIQYFGTTVPKAKKRKANNSPTSISSVESAISELMDKENATVVDICELLGSYLRVVSSQVKDVEKKAIATQDKLRADLRAAEDRVRAAEEKIEAWGNFESYASDTMEES